jgi:hypothetical protein
LASLSADEVRDPGGALFCARDHRERHKQQADQDVQIADEELQPVPVVLSEYGWSPIADSWLARTRSGPQESAPGGGPEVGPGGERR